MRRFEKISYEQFKKDVLDDKELYDGYNLPKRSTKFSAGYDFESIVDFVIKPGQNRIIPTGIKVEMNDSEALLLAVRSSQGFKYNVRLCNQVGIIDKDYYNNEKNEGHIFIKLYNEGTEDYIVKRKDKIIQGLFINYLIVDDEQEISKERTGWSYLNNKDKEK